MSWDCLNHRWWSVTAGCFLAACLGNKVSAQTPYDFNLPVGWYPYCLAVQPDNRILIAGAFEPQRLEDSGLLDIDFNATLNPPGAKRFPTVYSWAVQSDGKIIAGGDFQSLAGVACTNLCRLNPDGSVDGSFHASADSVFCLAVQPDGKVLVGGSFEELSGTPRQALGRLNPDGTVDPDFDPGCAGVPFSLAVQADGKIVVGGSFTSIAGGSRTNLARLMTDGTLDTSFAPQGIGDVNCLAGQADGKLLVGAFLAAPGSPQTNGLLRLTAQGDLDTNFNPQVNGVAYSVAVQADGKMVVGGPFGQIAGDTRLGVARLNADGTVDPAFVPLAYELVSALAIQNDGRILIGGRMVSADGVTNGYVGRVSNPDPATEVFGLAGTTLTWLRGGSSPELWSTQFSMSTNGINWANLGSGIRINDGWVLPGVTAPPGAILRAQGVVSVGQYNGAFWWVSSLATNGTAGAPVIISQPSSTTNYEAGSVVFRVFAGLGPLTYQWSKDGTNLLGATNDSLSLSNLQLADAGGYTVLVANDRGGQLSSTAWLRVKPRPSISSAALRSGQAQFWVTAQNCQWVIVEASTDLQHWKAIRTQFVGGGTVGFGINGSEPGDPTAQYYRVRQEDTDPP